MFLKINTCKNLKGEIKLQPNKSHSFRALILASLAEGTSKIKEPKISNDWEKGIEAMRMYGAEITQENDIFVVKGTGKNMKTPDDVINCGNSGQIFRFFMGVATGCEGYTVMTGDDSIRHIRLGTPLINSINELGGFAISTKNDGHAPVVIRGKIKGGITTIDGIDSQPVSGLLIACSLAEGNSEIKVINAGEKPWVGLTLNWFDQVGIEYDGNKFEHYFVKGNSHIKPFEKKIPLDWSAALYPILAGVIVPDSEIIIRGLDPDDSQGDKMAVDILKRMGADISVTKDSVIARSSELEPMDIDCNDFVDQFMLLAMAASLAKGKSKLYNAEVCRYKECDRINAMATELKKMGVDVEELKDGLIINGNGKLQGAKINGYKDHRMVMTFAVGSLVAKGETSISDAECIEKSFDDFVEQMRSTGANYILSKDIE